MDTFDIRSLYARGAGAFERGDLSGAETAFKQILNSHPAHANSLFYLGEIARLRGSLPEASWFYMKTLEVDAQHGNARAKLRQVQAQATDPTGSANEYKYAASAGRVDTEYYVPPTEAEAHDQGTRLAWKRANERRAAWEATPKALRVLYAFFAVLFFGGGVIVMLIVLLAIVL